MATDTVKSRTKRRKEERPQEIVQAAFEEFSESGFSATRLDDVARRAGVAKGTIYLYFESKEELFKAVVENKVVAVFESIREEIAPGTGSVEAHMRRFLPALAHRIVDSEIGAILSLIVAEGHRFPDLAQFYYERVIRVGLDNVSDTLRRGVEAGEFRDAEVRKFPQLLMAPMIMAIIWKAIYEPFDPLELDGYLSAHLDVLFNGIKA